MRSRSRPLEISSAWDRGLFSRVECQLASRGGANSAAGRVARRAQTVFSVPSGSGFVRRIITFVQNPCPTWQIWVPPLDRSVFHSAPGVEWRSVGPGGWPTLQNTCVGAAVRFCSFVPPHSPDRSMPPFQFRALVTAPLTRLRRGSRHPPAPGPSQQKCWNSVKCCRSGW